MDASGRARLFAT